MVGGVAVDRVIDRQTDGAYLSFWRVSHDLPHSSQRKLPSLRDDDALGDEPRDGDFDGGGVCPVADRPVAASVGRLISEPGST